jgi:hypothetical protein
MSELHKKEALEKVTANFDLVKGDFETNDATEIVTDLFDKKIHFHNLKKFSQEIRFGTEYDTSNERRMTLQLAKEQAKEWLDLASESGKSIRLNCTLTIEMI